MKLVIVGGVAGGASAAARARRVNESAEIILFERGEHISFANCGLPYYIGEEIEERDSLLVSTPRAMSERFNIDVRVNSEVVDIDSRGKTVEVRPENGEVYRESYDKLILAPGARPVKPPLPGIDLDTIFTLRNIPDMDRIIACIRECQAQSAAIVGGGFIGLEMAENLCRKGVKVTVVEMIDQVMAPFDADMAAYIHNHLRDKGVRLILEEAVESFEKREGKTIVKTAKGTEIETDMVILSIGVKPETDLAKKAGIELGQTGGILTGPDMRTSDPDIYAVGDAVEVEDFVSGAKTLLPLAGPANKQGRIAADNVMGKKDEFAGVQGTSVVKVFELTAACTGNNEKNLQTRGIHYLTSYTHSFSHASYYPGAQRMAIKLLFSPDNGEILGAQLVGRKGVDKRADVLATALRAGMTVYDLEEIDLGYAPPYGSAKDPVNIAGYVASNILKGDMEVVMWHEVENLDPAEYTVLDVRGKEEIEEHGKIENALHIPINDLRSRLPELEKDKTYVNYCAIGLRSYIAYRILVQNGFKALNISGGYASYLEPVRDQKARGNRQ
ncbi:MAG: FAD-dependent oxidoreductase [bacterium]